MSEIKHTPGLWWVGKSAHGRNTVICTEAANPVGTAIAFTVIRGAKAAADMDEAEANAELLASAPSLARENAELRAALESLKEEQQAERREILEGLRNCPNRIKELLAGKGA